MNIEKSSSEFVLINEIKQNKFSSFLLCFDKKCYNI